MFTHSLTITGCRDEALAIARNEAIEHITHVMPHVVAEATGNAEVITHLAYMAAGSGVSSDTNALYNQVAALGQYEQMVFPSTYNGTVTITRFAQTAAELSDDRNWDSDEQLAKDLQDDPSIWPVAEITETPLDLSDLGPVTQVDEITVVDYKMYSNIPYAVSAAKTRSIVMAWDMYVIVGGGDHFHRDQNMMIVKFDNFAEAQAELEKLNAFADAEAETWAEARVSGGVDNA